MEEGRVGGEITGGSGAERPPQRSEALAQSGSTRYPLFIVLG